jgi:hypothetical protein
MTSEWGAVTHDEEGTIAEAPDGQPSLKVFIPSGDTFGVNGVHEQLLDYTATQRHSVTLFYDVYLSSDIDYSAITTLNTDTIAYMSLPGLVGGQEWPGDEDHAYPANDEPMEGNNWSCRIRVSGAGKIGPYLYVQNKPAAFGWHRTSDHHLRINDLRGRWSTWSHTCIMNIPGEPNGRCIFKVDNEVIVDVDDLQYMDAEYSDVYNNGMRMHGFVQGSDSAPVNQDVTWWMKKFRMTWE